MVSEMATGEEGGGAESNKYCQMLSRLYSQYRKDQTACM